MSSNKSGMAYPLIELTTEQHQALVGSLLGDGHLGKRTTKSGNTYYTIHRAIKDIEYLKYEARLFENLLSPGFKENLVHDRYFLNNQTGKTHHAAYFYTSVNPVFNRYHDKWYLKDGTKIVPNDLELSPLTIAHWIADDACIRCDKLPYRFVIEFSTHGFTKAEVEFLAHLLHVRYNENFYIYPDRQYFKIIAYDSAARAIFADINSVFKMQRKRIWDDPTSRFYNNQPPRAKSTRRLLNAKKDCLQQIIELGNNTTYLELSHKLNLYYCGRVQFKRIDKLLEPYVKMGIIDKHCNKYHRDCAILIHKEK